MVQYVQWARAGFLAMAVSLLCGCQSPGHFKPALNNNPIKPGDVLLITCSSNMPPYLTKWVVDSNGNVRLPYAGPWMVAGKRPSELAKELSQYFSVGRKVTFTVEKFGAALFAPPARPPRKRAEKKPPPVLQSPKGAEAARSLKGNLPRQQDAGHYVPDG